MTYQNLIYTSSQFVITVAINNVPYQIVTGQVVDMNDSVEIETIHAVGQPQPIGLKTNAESYKGKLEVELGEWNAILLLGGFASGIRITGAVIAISAFTGGFNKTYSGVAFSTQGISVKAKDKQVLSSMDFEALSIDN